MVLIELGVEGADFALAVGVVEGVVERGGGNAEARGGDAVDGKKQGARAGLLIGGDVFDALQPLELGQRICWSIRSARCVGIFEGVLILRCG